MTDAAVAGRRPGASELLKSLGLLVDGPALWNRPVPSRAPGIFVIELPNGLRDAPVDIVAVRRWLERVPDLMLDGERPTPQEVAKRLHEFWLADEPVLYIGRSQKSIGARIAAIYATPLGDARPHSGANWLRTLSVLPDLRVWWSETNAHEEYEDALLDEVAARNAASGRDASTGALLPFANLMGPGGVPRAHGLTDSLLTDAADAKTAATTPSRRQATKRPTTRKQAAPGARKPALPRNAPLRPTAQPTMVSQEGLDKLNAELDNLRTSQRPQIIARVAAAREHGDLKENAEYQYARNEQSFMEGRIQALEHTLRNTELIERNDAKDSVQLGSTIVVESDGESFTYVIVGSTESNPAAGRVSNNSPVGRALLGARKGDDVVVELPSGSIVYRVVEVR